MPPPPPPPPPRKPRCSRSHLATPPLPPPPGPAPAPPAPRRDPPGPLPALACARCPGPEPAGGAPLSNMGPARLSEGSSVARRGRSSAGRQEGAGLVSNKGGAGFLSLLGSPSPLQGREEGVRVSSQCGRTRSKWATPRQGTNPGLKVNPPRVPTRAPVGAHLSPSVPPPQLAAHARRLRLLGSQPLDAPVPPLPSPKAS